MVATFQRTVRRQQTTGFQGEVIEDGPIRAFPGTLVSTNAATNIFGRVFTHIAGSDTNVTSGGLASVFAGILTSPKQNVTSGASTGALDPTLLLQNNEVGQLLDMGIIIVPLNGAASIGSNVYYDPVVANATAGEMSATQGGVYTAQVPNAKVVRRNTTATGLAYIQLAN